MSQEDDQWPAWVGAIVMALVLGTGVAGLVYFAMSVRSWDDFFSFVGPTAGPLGAGLIGALIVLVARLWLAWRLRTWSRRAESRVRSLVGDVEDERRLPAPERPTGASDDSLRRAGERLRTALVMIEGEVALPTAEALEAVRQLARDEWEPTAPLSREVEELHRLTSRAPRLRRGIDRELRREDRKDPGSGY